MDDSPTQPRGTGPQNADGAGAAIPSTSPSPRQRAKKWLKTVLRWGVAVVGVWWVVSQMSFSDKVLLARPGAVQSPVQQLTLDEPDATDNQAEFRVVGYNAPIPRDQLLNKPGKAGLKIDYRTPGGQPATGSLLGFDLEGDLNKNPRVARYFVQPPGQPAVWVDPSQLTKPFDLKVQYPRVDVGVNRLVRKASQKNLWLLVLAVVVFPVTFIMTAIRWHELLKALEIHIGLASAFTLNMVGAFYNTFMPGSTGGDVLKALYVSRQTTHRTRAVMSVIIDRVIGLLALIIIGGIAAATQWHNPQCRHIAIASFAILGCTALGLIVFYQPTLHRLFGLDWIIAHLPMQKQVRNAVEVMMIYRRRPGLVLLALVATFPVHATVILSAMFAGLAFDLPLPKTYYWAIVPVIVLAASVPISPQGAGVMEYFAVKLTETRGATVSQAFALTMSIRLVQILWNLTGAYFVLRGHYHAPTTAERREVREDAAEGDGPLPGAEAV